MEDFDVFTNEIDYTKPFYSKVLNSYINDSPSTPNGPNYQSGRKLLAEECLATKNELECAFNLSEAVSASVRTIAVYREEQMSRLADTNVMDKITNYIKPIQEIHDSYKNIDNKQSILPKVEQEFLEAISTEVDNVREELNKFSVEEVLPFHERYLRFSQENNSQNFVKILKELPGEWTIIQLTAPYNPNENLKPLLEYRVEINSLYISLFTSDYLEDCDMGPLTINLPAKFKEGVRPLFTELYLILDENYKTIDNAQFLNNKRLVQNYWSKREDIDLRMKSVINSMANEWLLGWNCLLTGKLQDRKLKEKIIAFVNSTIDDWGFLKLTSKQRFFMYKLFDGCATLNSMQIKHCIKCILTEHGNTEEVREALKADNGKCCNTDFLFLNELCNKCQAKGFEMVNKFTLVDGINAFFKAATQIQEEDEWAKLKKAKRYPVILIVDEMLDTFPWESLPIYNYHPVSRMENIHFIYYLYKIHEKDIVNGYFLAKSDAGRYVINPEKNLDRMEKRMGSFVRYWCGGWRGLVGEPPLPEQFLEYLNEADVFLYCGHGDGCALGAGSGAGGAGVEGARGRRVALLAGCGSARLAHPPGRAPPAAAHHALHIAHSPMVVGMLWEVTDLEVDKVVSTLVALCVPSEAQPAWPNVGKAKWSQGLLDTNVKQSTPFVPEYNLLRAVSRARGSTNYVMIASSVVARGLPVKIQKL